MVLSVNEEISGDRKKYQIQNKYDLVIKTVDDNDTGRYLCQNFDQVLSMNIQLTVLSKWLQSRDPMSIARGHRCYPTKTDERTSCERACLYLEIDLETRMKVKRWLTIRLDCFSIGWSSFEDSKGQLKKKKNTSSSLLHLLTLDCSSPQQTWVATAQSNVDRIRTRNICLCNQGRESSAHISVVHQSNQSEWVSAPTHSSHTQAKGSRLSS